MDEISVGSSYQSQDSYTKIFGVSSSNIIDSVAVSWPNGSSDKYFNIQVNQHITINQDQGISCQYDECGICGGDGTETYYDCDGNCLSDTDDDGICDGLDDCPNVYNPYQHDRDQDGLADACEDSDDDGDGLADCWDYWYLDGIAMTEEELLSAIQAGTCEDFTLDNNIQPSTINLPVSYTHLTLPTNREV